ncbi:Uncharacterized membrane protein YkgB [Amycolatopsis saalfeldensis]|uniref:Uncharacterized membrane protein YkgB n=1 Tax=Amycolatopsis saalfeldensis TaxID=394193 RepID=A0A1H8RRA0_9PSEU|nr:Uncharacterized membrane protein YkgB [Amycolatopsis saalfeldensis]
MAGAVVLRYGLVVVIAWIGALKFTASEAARIQQYVSHSPFLSWTSGVLDPGALSAVFGTIELAAALLIALRPLLPRSSAVGSLLAVGLFLTTLSFLFTTPGIGDPAAGGLPALSPTGQFLLKDLVLLGASLWTLGESQTAAARRGSASPAAA